MCGSGNCASRPGLHTGALLEANEARDWEGAPLGGADGPTARLPEPRSGPAGAGGGHTAITRAKRARKTNTAKPLIDQPSSAKRKARQRPTGEHATAGVGRALAGLEPCRGRPLCIRPVLETPKGREAVGRTKWSAAERLRPTFQNAALCKSEACGLPCEPGGVGNVSPPSGGAGHTATRKGLSRSRKRSSAMGSIVCCGFSANLISIESTFLPNLMGRSFAMYWVFALMSSIAGLRT